MAGQQGQEYSGKGLQLSDKEILQICLNESKHTASALNTFILEATDDKLRRDYMTVLGDLYSQQKEVFDLMQQKGYYSPKQASPQDLAQAQTNFSGQNQQQGQQQSQ